MNFPAIMPAQDQGMNMENIVETAQFQAQKFLDIALGWLLSPQAWCQFGLLIAAFFAAYFLSKLLSPRLRSWLMFPETRPNVIIEAAKFLIVFLPLLLPLVAMRSPPQGKWLVVRSWDLAK